MDEISDLERSRLLLGWLAARRAVDHCLSDLLAAGPAGERRVRESLALVDDLESREHAAFDRYRAAVATAVRNTPGGSAADRPAAGAGLTAIGPVGSPVGDPADGDAAAGGVRAGEPACGEAAVADGLAERVSDLTGRLAEAADAGARGHRQRPGWGRPERPRLNLVRTVDGDRSPGFTRSRSNTPGNQGHR